MSELDKLKEIIIDGVNVAECAFYKLGVCISPINKSCKDCNDIDINKCYFKQLKRLQAENFELKETLKVFQRPDIQKVLTLYKVGDIDLLEQKCERLEQENEELKALCDTYKTCYRAKHNDIKGNLFKYKQALEKIRETLNNMPTTTDFKETETFLRIQTQINEVLDD